jgi:Na+(H+)/acetate symporter ActP
MTRMVMTVGMVIGAYVAGMNGITHVEVMEYIEIAMGYSESAIIYADRIMDAVASINVGERAEL